MSTGRGQCFHDLAELGELEADFEVLDWEFDEEPDIDADELIREYEDDEDISDIMEEEGW